MSTLDPTQTITLLDHGFVKLHNLAGPTRRPEARFDADSIDPANTARMSFGQMNSDRTREDDLKLVKYLISNQHGTPIEMIEAWFEFKLPIFVARQFVRHRTATINEISGRYVVLPEEWYIPEIVGAKPTDGAKQGQEDTLSEEVQANFKAVLSGKCAESYEAYLYFLKDGVAPEHARLFLHVNHYTQWMWKQDLRNIIGFLGLRLDAHAQIEAQMYARAMLMILRQMIPDIMLIAIPDDFDPDSVSLAEFEE